MTPELTNGEGKESPVKPSLVDKVRSRLDSDDMDPFLVGGEINSRREFNSETTFITTFFIAPQHPFYDVGLLNPTQGNIVNRLAIDLPTRRRLPQYDESGNFMILGTIAYEELIAIRRTRTRKTTTVFQGNEAKRLNVDLSAKETVADHSYQQMVEIVLIPDPRLAYLAGLAKNGNLNLNAVDELLLEARVLNFKALKRLAETSGQVPEFLDALAGGKRFTRDELYKLMFGKKGEKEFQKLQLSRR